MDKFKPRRARMHRRRPLIITTPPEISLDIYTDGTTLLTRRSALGWQTYPVAQDDIKQALAAHPTSSGLLPPNTLATGQYAGHAWITLYVPAQPAIIQVQADSYPIMLPPLLWSAWNSQYRLVAWPSPDWPADPTAIVAHAPLPNIFPDGRLCWGSVPQPMQTDWASIVTALETFLTSTASNHLISQKSQRYSGSILRRYADLHPDAPYPLDDLLPMGVTLRDIVRGDWVAGGRR